MWDTGGELRLFVAEGGLIFNSDICLTSHVFSPGQPLVTDRPLEHDVQRLHSPTAQKLQRDKVRLLCVEPSSDSFYGSLSALLFWGAAKLVQLTSHS